MISAASYLIKELQIQMTKEQAEKERRALIQMYQAGFLDGFNFTRFKIKTFNQIKQRCLTSFNIRFAKEVIKGLKKH